MLPRYFRNRLERLAGLRSRQGRRSNRPRQFFPVQIAAGDLRPSSAPFPALVFNGLARTVRSGRALAPSASSASVRRCVAAKLLSGLVFGSGADRADDADGPSAWFSAAANLAVAEMLMMRVRARPSRPKLISMPTLGRNVAARRSRPDAVRTVRIMAHTAAATGSAPIMPCRGCRSWKFIRLIFIQRNPMISASLLNLIDLAAYSTGW